MIKLFTTLISCVAVAILMAPSALAKKPDRVMPANEGVCDGLKGFPSGLYGLCVAFCEAQDHAAISVPITEEDLEALQEGVPSGRILANYYRKKKTGDPHMPCIKVEEPCPCWDSAEFDQATLSGPVVNGCLRWNGPKHVGSFIQRFQSNPWHEGVVLTIDHLHGADNHRNAPMCHYGERRDAEGINYQRMLPITPEELMACDARIRQRMTELSLTCTDSSN